MRDLSMSLFVAATVATGCGSGLPEPPDTSELEGDYAAPTAALDLEVDDLGGLLDAVVAINEALGRGDALVEGGVEPVEPEEPDPEEGEPGEPRPLPYDFEGAGVARITTICPGWPEDEERSDEVSGHLTTMVRFDTDADTSISTLDAVFWGEAERCAFSNLEQRVRLDGEVIFVRVERGVIISLAGELEIDGRGRDGVEIDFLVHGGGVDYRRRLGERGHVIITIDTSGVPLIHATNGDFRCTTDGCQVEAATSAPSSGASR